ncbi:MULTISPECIES: hypothetical protein [unclassified Paraburkholderia]|uniref:hypothetical protein n=1 Tax=unclassified Paraburkholderia TaxID=2615204 RepID=UPI00183F0FE8|nr:MULTISPECIES: hypothetical protein [unclassified Paraburkholderia]MBB5410077.1 hypothetical protein [Paraburkholderia sp. HC6.4b]MBB5452008.1 hypothetical protein [Paraburkholderia sp. Kb1A]
MDIAVRGTRAAHWQSSVRLRDGHRQLARPGAVHRDAPRRHSIDRPSERRDASTLHIAALDGNTCQREPLACINTILTVGGINTDRRLSSLAELSLQMAITNTPANASDWSDAIRSVAQGRAIRVCISVPR